MESQRFRLIDWVLLVIVLAGAAGARVWYLIEQAEAASKASPIGVQSDGEDDQLQLVENLRKDRRFASQAPLADSVEATAHTSPGYPWLLSLAAQATDDWQRLIRWIQAGLGVLTAGFYFLFARRAFRSLLVAALTGLFCAFYPFWVVNCAEIADGTLASFLLGACLLLGVHAGQVGGPTASLLLGVGLAALCLVRAPMLPFAVVTMLWFLLRCRWLKRGWLYAVLAFLGFINGLVPWTLRNLQTFGDVLPVVDSVYLHLWIGNHPGADGGSLDRARLSERLEHNFKMLPRENEEKDAEIARLIADLHHQPQKERYQRLATLVLWNIRDDPAGTVQRRLSASLCFLLGSDWVVPPGLVKDRKLNHGDDLFAGVLAGTLLGLLILAVLGWRWTYPFQKTSMPMSLALIWIPIPYILSHAEALSGPRLPLDGVLLCYAAFALACLIPGFNRNLFAGPNPKGE
jgi:hypothetical protein